MSRVTHGWTWAVALSVAVIASGCGSDEAGSGEDATTVLRAEAEPRDTTAETDPSVVATTVAATTSAPDDTAPATSSVPDETVPATTIPAATAVPTTVVPVAPPSAIWDGTYIDEPASGSLQVGHTGARVAELQRGLGAAGLLAGPFDGDFGPGTERALLAFQAQRGLPVDGIGGAVVLEALASTAPAVPAAPTGGWALRGDGIGDLRFGGAGGSTTSALDARFGAPRRSDSYVGQSIGGGLYAAPIGDPSDRANAWIVPEPSLQIRCYANGLCAYLGGASAAALAFRGWSLSGTDDGGQPLPPSGLATLDGVTLGSSTTAFPSLVRRTGTECFASAGVADAAGTIAVTFDDTFDTADEPVIPAPGTPLAVTWMSAGTIPDYGDGCS